MESSLDIGPSEVLYLCHRAGKKSEKKKENVLFWITFYLNSNCLPPYPPGTTPVICYLSVSYTHELSVSYQLVIYQLPLSYPVVIPELYANAL